MDENCPKLRKLISKPKTLKRIIECPVCHEVPFPPIYQCITGHNVCKSCKPKLQKCPICEKVFSDTRNHSVEQMVLASSHSCAYKDEGCQDVGTGQVLCDHVKICQYRSFMCPGVGTFGTRNHCPGTVSIKLSQAKNHFLATHKSMKTDSKTIFTVSFNFVVADHSKLKQDTSWPPSLIEVNGRNFLGQLYIRNDIFYWTIFCLGTEEEAAHYKAEITFSSVREDGNSFQWKVPVQPIVKCEQLRDGNEMKDALIPSCSFNDFKWVAVRDDVSSNYKFHVGYKILKL